VRRKSRASSIYCIISFSFPTNRHGLGWYFTYTSRHVHSVQSCPRTSSRNAVNPKHRNLMYLRRTLSYLNWQTRPCFDPLKHKWPRKAMRSKANLANCCRSSTPRRRVSSDMSALSDGGNPPNSQQGLRFLRRRCLGWSHALTAGHRVARIAKLYTHTEQALPSLWHESLVFKVTQKCTAASLHWA